MKHKIKYFFLYIGVYIGILLSLVNVFEIILNMYFLFSCRQDNNRVFVFKNTEHSEEQLRIIYSYSSFLALAGGFIILFSLIPLIRAKAEVKSVGEQMQFLILARRRTMAWFIDVVIIPAIITAGFDCDTDNKDLKLVSLFIAGGVSTIYILFKDGITGQSIGKWLMKIKTVSWSGSPCSLVQSFKRNLWLLLPVFPWLIAAQVWGYLPLRLGDRWAKTRVILL